MHSCFILFRANGIYIIHLRESRDGAWYLTYSHSYRSAMQHPNERTFCNTINTARHLMNKKASIRFDIAGEWKSTRHPYHTRAHRTSEDIIASHYWIVTCSMFFCSWSHFNSTHFTFDSIRAEANVADDATCDVPITKCVQYTPEAKEHAFALAHVNFVNENVICILSTNLFCPTNEREKGGERQSKGIRWEAVRRILCITRIQTSHLSFCEPTQMWEKWQGYECGGRILPFFPCFQFVVFIDSRSIPLQIKNYIFNIEEMFITIRASRRRGKIMAQVFFGIQKISFC